MTTWAEWVERRADHAFGAHASRNGALNAAAWTVGRALHWHDADEGEARAILEAAARAAGLPDDEIGRVLRRSLRDGARRPLDDLRRPTDPWAPALPARRRRERRASTPAPTDRDPRAWRIRQTWADAPHASDDDEASAYLRRRGIDPHRLWAHDVARVRGDDAPPWATFGRMEPHRLWAPLYDASGELCSVRMRRLDAAPDGSPKTLGPANVAMRGRVLACTKGRRMLAGDATAARHGVLILEGETDLWTWASRLTGDDAPALLAVPGSGSWSRAFADRIPAGTRVAVLTDRDDAGRAYLEKIGRDLRGRCNAFTRTWTGIEGCDENDLARAGRLPADPWDGLIPLFVEIEGVAVPVVEHLTLDDLRARLSARMLGALNEPGAHVVVAPTGAGKSHAAMRAALTRWKRGGWVRWSRREHRSLEAARAELLKVADDMVRRGELTDRDRADLDTVAIIVPAIGDLCEAPHRAARYRAATGTASAACAGCPLRERCEYQRRHEQHRQARHIAGSPLDPFDVAGALVDQGRALLWSNAEIIALARRPWIRFTTHAHEATSPAARARGTDLHVVDESPHDALWTTETINMADVHEWADAGDLTMTDDALGKVSRLLRGGDRTSAEIAAAFASVQPSDDRGGVASRMVQAAAQTPHDAPYDPADPDQRLTPKTALDALCDALTQPDGWRGAFVYGGTLTVRRRLTFAGNTTCRIYLDATAEPALYEAIGADRWHVFGTDAENADRVHHITAPQRWTPHPSNVSNADTLRRLTHLWGSDDGATLYVMPRKLRDALDDLGTDAPAGYRVAREADRVTYHGSAESRGTNQWGDLSRVVVVAHHVPRVALEAETEWIGGGEIARATANRRLNIAPVVQAIGRVARDRGAQRNVEIIGAAPCLYGYENAERADADLEAWRMGAAPHGRACLAEWLRATFDEHATGTGIASLPELLGRVQGTPLPSLSIKGGEGVCLAHWQKAIENAYMGSDAGGLSALYQSAGLGALRVRMGRASGGTETVLAFAGWEPTHGELEAWARSLPAHLRPRWIEWGDGGTEHRVDLWDAVQAYDVEIRALATAGQEPTTNAVAAEHAARGGASSRRTVYNHLKGREADVRALWQAYRDEAEARIVSIAPPDPGAVEAFDERAAILEVDAGKPRDDAEREAARMTTGRASDVHRLRRVAGDARPARAAWGRPVLKRTTLDAVRHLIPEWMVAACDPRVPVAVPAMA